ncbi:hypothetical protein F4775DRAFT_572344 [Biscogniauxia sp. FL1348]|nr:hypothetical protein F4775DRAFT_572344 [Biscogniauxia sp. FL1348]
MHVSDPPEKEIDRKGQARATTKSGCGLWIVGCGLWVVSPVRTALIDGRNACDGRSRISTYHTCLPTYLRTYLCTYISTYAYVYHTTTYYHVCQYSKR